MQHRPVSILVTSAGTASAISVIKALKQQRDLDLTIIAVDMDMLAAGLYLADKFYLVPKASDPNYINELIRISKIENVEILIPIYSKELQLISENREILAGAGIKTMLPKSSAIQLANDKFKMGALMDSIGIPSPIIYDVKNNIWPDKFPVFIKPNTGSSSAGAAMIHTLDQLREVVSSGQDIIVQEYINGDEVTVDILCDEKSEPIVIAPRIRLAIKSGQSTKGKTLSKKIFEEPVKKVCQALGIVGVCNIQFFLVAGELVFIELNPRYAAGGLMLTVNSGANIPLLVVKYLLDLPIHENECLTAADYTMTRYWQEIILDEKGRVI